METFPSGGDPYREGKGNLDLIVTVHRRIIGQPVPDHFAMIIRTQWSPGGADPVETSNLSHTQGFGEI
jgi:hypothetical protein